MAVAKQLLGEKAHTIYGYSEVRMCRTKRRGFLSDLWKTKSMLILPKIFEARFVPLNKASPDI